LARRLYQDDPDRLKLDGWLGQVVSSDSGFQFTFVGPDGVISNTGIANAPIGFDVADREYFRVHVESTSDTLFISTPILLRGTKKWSIVLSRRVIAADGAFGGIITAAFDFDQIERVRARGTYWNEA
jgi:hypothetical protein